MLNHLTIRHYAIIDELELSLREGLTALTGETGAGKSILLGALGLVLGDRADSDIVKQSHDHAEIIAEFDISKLESVQSWLVEHELNADDECILRRRVSADGRSRAFINGTPVNLQRIRELAEMLIDIHGQHEHQSIMKPFVQRQLLDDYAGHKPLLEAVSDVYVKYKLVQEQLNHLSQSSQDRNSRIDLLRFQTQELDNLALQENEYQQLNAQHGKLANADKLISTTQQALLSLHEHDEFNIQSELSRIHSQLMDAAEHDERLQTVTDVLQEALVNIEEAISELRHVSDSIELDPAQLEQVEQRMQSILDIARKHHVEPEQLNELHQQLQQELDDIDHADERLEQLQAEHDELLKQYHTAAGKLSNSRKKFARQLGKQITAAMQTLGMKGGVFEIEVAAAENNDVSVYGVDRIQFNVSANAGHSAKALSRVASGGELARISLAIQMITAGQSRIPTLIFDEVDSGVGGGIAEIVGQHLRALGNTNQVMCITHLPQVASQAHQHYRVHKQMQNGQTRTDVTALDDKQRIEEIARMLSGVEITQKSLENAEEMIKRAQAC